ncbi:MAG: site-specific DNA-methyltransferase [Fusobacteriaceae bacterium]
MELEDRVPVEINNIKNENLELLKSLFPSVIKDGQVDFKALKEELGEFEEVKEERYEFNWAGKQNAKKIVQENVGARTLKYIEEDSKNPDTTENLYIEGDNLEVLKLLRQNYFGSIKMIYIDPPYNTDKDFIYNDSFKMKTEESNKSQGYIDEDNIRLEKTKIDGNKYHANWLNMMYPRLKIAKDLLTDDGVIFISIANEEIGNLKKICDDIFDENNLVENFIWEKTSTPPSLSNKSRKTIEYILCYEKNKNNTKYYGELLENGDAPLMNTGNMLKVLTFPKGSIEFKIPDGIYPKGKYHRIELLSDINVVNGVNDSSVISKGEFKWKQETLEEEISNGTYFLIKTLKFSIRFQRPNTEGFKTPLNYLGNIKFDRDNQIGTNESATKELNELNLNSIFDYPKPVSLIKKIIKMITHNEKESIILDFFSGSSTTAHAVMQLNAEDDGNRKYIMVQLNELTYDGKKKKYKDENGEEKEQYIIDPITKYPIVNKDSEARKEGFYTIAQIGKERIRRAGELIKNEIEESNKKLKFDETLRALPDIGFKAFRTADTNINWKKISKKLEDNILKIGDLERLDFTPNSNDKDVMYEVLLRQRDLHLSKKNEVLSGIGARTYLYDSSYLVCLETTITREIVEKLAELNPLPLKFFFRDSAFGSKISLKEETFRRLKTLVEKNSGFTKKAYTVEFI